MTYDPNNPSALETKARLAAPYVTGKQVVDVGVSSISLFHSIQQSAAGAIGIVCSPLSPPALLLAGKPIVRGNALRLPVPDRIAQTVLSFGTLPYQRQKQDFFRELVRITTPGGYLLVEAANRSSFASIQKPLAATVPRLDLLVEIKMILPHELELKEVLGVQLVPRTTPLLERFGESLDRVVSGSLLRFFSTALILVLRKRDDL
ncbi:MAG: methyltransferase domain-containing protein [Myxococcales bacterium]|nr:methyltransferase domain-containing protein [Myxococcales bacterium]